MGHVGNTSCPSTTNTLQWDSEGFICRVSQDVALSPSRKLGIMTLSISQFMDLARRRAEVNSSHFTEWFTDSYSLSADGTCGNHLVEDVPLPVGRPGWFRLEHIDQQGFPTQINSRSTLGQWKYWSPNSDDIGVKCGAMRSFVTSSGTCALDLGIPA